MGRVRFGQEDQHVDVDVRGRSYPDRADSADGNWLTAWIDVRVRPFAGTFVASWRAEFLAPFRHALEQLYDALEGEAVFRPDWEGSLEIALRGDGRGHVSVGGTACPDGARGPWLRFELPAIDQTYLPPLIQAMKDLEEEFPPYR